MYHKNSRQLTPYETRIYFVPDMTARDERKKQLNAIDAQINAINNKLHNQLHTMNGQINAINNQLQTLDAQKKGIRALKFKGSLLIAIDFIRIGILASIDPFIKFHLLLLLDPHLCEILYIILLLVEAYLIGKPKKSKKIYWPLILWVCLSISFLYSLANAQNVGNTINYFYLFCLILQLCPLFIGIGLVYTATKKEKINLKATEQKKAEQKNLQNKREERKLEQNNKIWQKQAELRNLQGKKLQQIPPPTDQELDAWLESRVRERLTFTLRKLGLDDEIANHRQLLRVRGYVLPGMKDARHYRTQDLRYKLGADGKRRYSLNLYTYFYPADHQIMVFTYEINAMNWSEGRETTKEYFYHDIIGAETVDDSDQLYIEGKPYSYRTQSFRLKLCDGTAISATVRSRPLDDMTSLPVFDIPQSDIDDTVANLRMLLRTKKR